jgi:hypothetical protein
VADSCRSMASQANNGDLRHIRWRRNSVGARSAYPTYHCPSQLDIRCNREVVTTDGFEGELRRKHKNLTLHFAPNA